MRFAFGQGLYDHEVVFWLGDLNYRLNTFSYEDAVKQCNTRSYTNLFYFDQLNEQQRLKTAFNGFHERQPTFRPTYKFDVGTSNWDTRCDRILYWIREKNIKIEQINYTSVEKVVFSDHKPVCSSFKLVVKLINPKKRNIVYEEVLRESDKRNKINKLGQFILGVNELLPSISLSKTEVLNFWINIFKLQFQFGDVYFNQPAVSILTIKNTGMTPTNFSFASTHHGEGMPQNWLTITPISSFLEKDTEVEVQLQVVIQDEKVPDNFELTCILVIRLDQGRDYFVVVSAKYRKTNQTQEPETEKIVAPTDEEWLMKFE